MRNRLLTIGAVVLLALAPSLAGGAARQPQKKTVKIGDNFFSPKSLTVNRGSTVTWRWPEDAGDTHDVVLYKAPKGVKKWRAPEASSLFSYRRKFTKPGEYRILCSLHAIEMRMVVKVRR